MIISVGYRVKSQRGVQFRIWASNIIKEYPTLIRPSYGTISKKINKIMGYIAYETILPEKIAYETIFKIRIAYETISKK